MDTQFNVTPNIFKGSLLALVAFFFMALFGILTKLALQTSSFFWVSFIAYLTASLVLVPYIAQKGLGYLKSEHYLYLFGRAILGTLASFFYTVSIHYIPIVNGTLLFNTAPIFIPILCVCFLKSNIAKSIWLAVAIGFLGIIIIIHPTEALFTQTGNLVGIASGVLLAMAYLLMKLLTATDPGVRIIFYYLSIGTIIQIPLLFFSEFRIDGEGVMYSILCGLALVCAQLALVNAYKYAKASEVGIYQYSSVVFVGILNWIIWNEVPPLMDLLGVALVAIAGIIIIRHSSEKPHEIDRAHL